MSNFTDIESALIANNLNFGMTKENLLFVVDNNQFGRVPDKVAVINEDTRDYLGVVGRNYGLVRYRDSFAFLNPLLEDGTVELIACKKTRNGARVYIHFVAPGSIELGYETIVNGFHLFSSCDGSKEIEVHIAPTRLIQDSDGTITNAGLFVTNITPVKFRHSSAVETRLKAAAKTYEKVVEGFNSFNHDIQKMVKQGVTDEQAKEYIELTIPGDGNATIRTREDIYTSFKVGRCAGLVQCKGTLYGALSAVMMWADSCRPRKAKWINEADARVESAMLGTTARKKLVAYATALQFAKNFGMINNI